MRIKERNALPLEKRVAFIKRISAIVVEIRNELVRNASVVNTDKVQRWHGFVPKKDWHPIERIKAWLRLKSLIIMWFTITRPLRIEADTATSPVW